MVKSLLKASYSGVPKNIVGTLLFSVYSSPLKFTKSNSCPLIQHFTHSKCFDLSGLLRIF